MFHREGGCLMQGPASIWSGKILKHLVLNVWEIHYRACLDSTPGLGSGCSRGPAFCLSSLCTAQLFVYQLSVQTELLLLLPGSFSSFTGRHLWGCSSQASLATRLIKGEIVLSHSCPSTPQKQEKIQMDHKYIWIRWSYCSSSPSCGNDLRKAKSLCPDFYTRTTRALKSTDRVHVPGFSYPSCYVAVSSPQTPSPAAVVFRAVAMSFISQLNFHGIAA